MRNYANIGRFVDKFKHQWIGVIGDVMLDHYVMGDAHRISPEAPAPVVDVAEEIFILGGAANVAKNIAAMRSRVSLLGVIGGDAAGERILRMLKSEKMDTSGILASKNRITTEKMRVVARGQQMMRLDREKKVPLSPAEEEKLLGVARKNMPQWDGVVLSDYAKGVVTQGLAGEIIAIAKKHKKPILVDPKPENALYFRGASVLTPNAKEAEAISGVSDISKSGKMICKKLGCNVLITRGQEGMTLFGGDKEKHFPAMAKEVFDVTGAGDTVAAVAMLSLASGATLEESAHLANCAAGIVVGKQGTATLTKEELKNSLI